MTTLQLANVLQAFAVAMTGFVVFFWIVPTWRLDALRQKLFSTRDDLFLYAANGHIAFNDPAYRLLRDHINSLIRYAHQLTLFRLLLSNLGHRVSGFSRVPPPGTVPLERAISDVKDSQVRDKLNQYHQRAVFSIIKHVILGSPILLVCVMGFIVFNGTSLLAVDSMSSARRIWQAASRRVMKGPLDPSVIEAEAFCALS